MNAAAALTETAPRLECSKCKATVPLDGKRIGDSMSCSACGALNVVTRSRAKGDVPAALQAGGMTAADREEVAEVLQRIKLLRIGRASRHVDLYPSWAVFLAGVQFYLSGILAGENLIQQGDVERGRKLQVMGVVSYLAVGGGLLAVALWAGESVPLMVGAGVLLGVPLFFASWFTVAQHRACAAARDAGAGNAPVLLPLLLGLILAIAQAFAIWFIKLRLDGPF